jgi:hypothetical protein
VSCDFLVGAFIYATGAELVSTESRGEGVVATYKIGDDTYRVQFDRMPVNHNRRESDTKEQS